MAVTGGFTFNIAGVRVATHDATRIVLFAAALLIAGYAASGRRFDREIDAVAGLAPRATGTIVALAAA